MAGAVALVVGLCVLSFAAGCALTAVVRRRGRTRVPAPLPAPEPVVAPPAPPMDLRLPPEDYATRPIHRNPVMGIPAALPASEPTRPLLSLVPDLDAESEPEVPTPQDQVRRMRVVRDAPEPDEPTRRESNR